MPRANTIRPGSLTERILRYYQEHPGMHRCMDVSPHVHIPTHRVAVLSARLHERGLITKEAVRTYGRTTPVPLYGIAAVSAQAQDEAATPEPTGADA